MKINITQEMSDKWLAHREIMSQEDLQNVNDWLYKKKFFDLTEKQMVAFFLKINKKKYIDYQAQVWYILFVNKIIDRVVKGLPDPKSTIIY